MDEIKRLLGFVVEENPKILISPCSFAQELKEKLNGFEVSCADTECKEKKDCIKINLNAPFLPISKFNIWIVDVSKFKMSIGYVFYLARNTLKNNGVLAVKGKEEVDDGIASSYGLQILYHGSWHYYLRG